MAKKQHSHSVNVLKEPVPRPVGICLNDVRPYSTQIVVTMEYHLHNGTQDMPGKRGYEYFFFEQEEILPEIAAQIKAMEENPFAAIGDRRNAISQSRMAGRRDWARKQFFLKVCQRFDDYMAPSRSEKFEEIERFMLKDPECSRVFREYARMEGIMAIIDRPEFLIEDSRKRDVLTLSQNYLRNFSAQ